MYYRKGAQIREKLRDKDLFLANDYAALARLKILGFWSLDNDEYSSDLHQKCLKILKDKYPMEQITRDEIAFHDKYYGNGLVSVMKFMPWNKNSHMIEKFKCYNKELNICE